MNIKSEKRKYWPLIFGFLVIAIGFLLSFIPYLLGGYSVENMENHINFYIFGFLIMAGIGLIFLGIIISIILFIIIYTKNKK